MRMAELMRLSAQNLGCRRGGRDVFADLGFSLGRGEALAVTGPNGSGKSSLLRLLAGLLRPAAGRIELEGGDADLTLAEQAHYLGHQDALKSVLTVRENLQFWSDYLGGGEDCREALVATGLSELADIPAAYLSAGQRRRLSLARLVGIKRPVWLLDEPASTLDSAGQTRLAELMGNHLHQGGLIVAATHAPLGIAARELQLGTAR